MQIAGYATPNAVRARCVNPCDLDSFMVVHPDGGQNGGVDEAVVNRIVAELTVKGEVVKEHPCFPWITEQ